MSMSTVQQIKDAVAKGEGFESWEEFVTVNQLTDKAVATIDSLVGVVKLEAEIDELLED